MSHTLAKKILVEKVKKLVCNNKYKWANIKLYYIFYEMPREMVRFFILSPSDSVHAEKHSVLISLSLSSWVKNITKKQNKTIEVYGSRSRVNHSTQKMSKLTKNRSNPTFSSSPQTWLKLFRENYWKWETQLNQVFKCCGFIRYSWQLWLYIYIYEMRIIKYNHKFIVII